MFKIRKDRIGFGKKMFDSLRNHEYCMSTSYFYGINHFIATIYPMNIIIWKKASYSGAGVCTGIWGYFSHFLQQKASYSGADSCTGIWGFFSDFLKNKFHKKPHIPVQVSDPEYEAFFQIFLQQKASYSGADCCTQIWGFFSDYVST